MTRTLRWTGLLFCLALASCGGGSGGSFTDDDLTPWEQRTARSDKLANLCANPRKGTDPYNDNKPYPDQQGSLSDEQRWLRTYMDEVYLWYEEIPSINAAPYTVANYGNVQAAMSAYFRALRVQTLIASGRPKDQFSFIERTDLRNQAAQDGIVIGYGVQIALLAAKPPRKALVAYTEPGTPGAAKNVERGAEVVAIDGAAFVDGDPAVLNAGLFPDTVGEMHQFVIRDRGATTTRTITLTATAITSVPVLATEILDTPTGRVGYVLFNDHIATAEGQLITAMSQLRNQQINDLVLDLRYNGGGYLDIASEVAFMIAGSTAVEGALFERQEFNDKHPLRLGGENVTAFHAASQGFDETPFGTALPQLSLPRVFILATGDTCSASEAIINGLRGIDIEVVLIGDTTCGKPYGFYQQDNCGLSYFAIEFAGINQKGFGDYADGFDPSCSVEDDYTHALGDPQESLFATTLQYRNTGTCPVTAKSETLSSGKRLVRSPSRENRYYRQPHR